MENSQLIRAKRFYADYVLLGTLRKVAKKHNVSLERVRQILKIGDSAGLFQYPHAFSITPEKLKEDYLKYGSIRALSKYYNTSENNIRKAIRKYRLPANKLRLERLRNKVHTDYEKVVKDLGHHPTATELEKDTQWKVLYNRISSYYGSLNDFRKTHDYPIPRLSGKTSNFTKKAKEAFQINRKRILTCVTTKPGATMPEIVNTLGLTLEAVRLHLLKLTKEGTIYDQAKGRFHYYFPKSPKISAKSLNLSDLKNPLKPEDKLFIDKLSSLYSKYGSLAITAKKMGIGKIALYNKIDDIVKSGCLHPIKSRGQLILSLRVKEDYDKMGRIDEVGKLYGFSDVTASKYLRYGNAAGLFRYPNPLRMPQGIPRAGKTEDIYSKGNIAHILKIKQEYNKLGSLKRVGKAHNLSHEEIRQFLIRGDEIGLFEFPPRKKLFYSRITKEKLLESLLKYEGIYKVGKHHRVSTEQIKEAMKTYKISMRDIQNEIDKRKALKAYEELVRELGHHPSTTEIKIRHHYLLFRIKKTWGSIHEFRKVNGFPGPQIGPPVKTLNP